MAEYIDRKTAIAVIRNYFENLPWNGLSTTVADDCEKLLKAIPKHDVWNADNNRKVSNVNESS